MFDLYECIHLPSRFPWPGGTARPCHGQHGFGSFCRNKRTSSSVVETPAFSKPFHYPDIVDQAFDAFRLAPKRDALRIWRPLCEPCELGRSSKSSRPSSSVRPDGASMVLGPFAETKGPRRPGTKPRSQITRSYPAQQHPPPGIPYLPRRRVHFITPTMPNPQAIFHISLPHSASCLIHR